jgi:endoglucanase
MKFNMLAKKLVTASLVLAIGGGCISGCGSAQPEDQSAQVQQETVEETADEQQEAAGDTAEETDDAQVAEAEEEQAAESAEEASEEDAVTEDESAAETETEDASEESEEVITEAEDDTAEVTETEEELTADMRDIPAADLIAEMTTGWNLGNTFDSYGTKGVAAETSWGNPKTTKEMIDAVHAKGFDLIRIPTTWMDHMGEAPDYTVDPEWFARVEEVINYALDNDMYVILNTHHEEDWRIPDDAHIEEVDVKHAALWKQIAEYFKDYGDHLIFEGLNEPRIKGDAHEWDGGTGEVRDCLNRLNKTFVDTVRATGGNNSKRLLLITTVAASHVPVTINNLEVPEDEHVAVSIHAYTPYAFTFDIDDDWEINSWDGSKIGDIRGMFSDLARVFLNRGIPVIITEYGAIDKNDDVEDVTRWVNDYLSLAKKNGIPCIWWDNGQFSSGNEHFAIFNRQDLSWYRESVVDEIMNVYSE